MRGVDGPGSQVPHCIACLAVALRLSETEISDLGLFEMYTGCTWSHAQLTLLGQQARLALHRSIRRSCRQSELAQIVGRWFARLSANGE